MLWEALLSAEPQIKSFNDLNAIIQKIKTKKRIADSINDLEAKSC